MSHPTPEQHEDILAFLKGLGLNPREENLVLTFAEFYAAQRKALIMSAVGLGLMIDPVKTGRACTAFIMKCDSIVQGESAEVVLSSLKR